MPNWAGSSWYFLRYTDPNNSDKLADEEKLKYWMPVDHYEGGAEHVTLHLLYSRFWHKFLYDIGIVPTKEPYQKRTIHGNVLGEDGTKMSKSVGNVINPDDIIEKYGADVVRAYMMFMGPYEGDVLWNTETINGVKRFVSKYYRFLLLSWEKKDKSLPKTQRAVSKLINRVEQDILNFKFNTTISALMEFYNEFNQKIFSKEDLEKIIITSAPIFPHLAEEIWEKTGHNYSVHMQEWPEVKKEHLEDEKVEIPIQINGKVRGKITVSSEIMEDEVREKVLLQKDLEPYLKDKEIKKLIYVPNRIVNIVI